MAGDEGDSSGGEDPGALAAGAAGTVSRLLARIEAGEVTAPPGLVARLEGAEQALRALAEHGERKIGEE